MAWNPDPTLRQKQQLLVPHGPLPHGHVLQLELGRRAVCAEACDRAAPRAAGPSSPQRPQLCRNQQRPFLRGGSASGLIFNRYVAEVPTTPGTQTDMVLPQPHPKRQTACPLPPLKQYAHSR